MEPLPFPDIEKIAEPLRPPAEAGGAWWWWWVAAVLLGLILVGIITWAVINLSRRAALPSAPVRPDKQALRALKNLRRNGASLGGMEFGSALADIVRTFLQRRLGMPARFSTTPEILGRSRDPDDPPPPPVITAFAPVLEGCDELKFSAGGTAARESLLDAAEAAVKAVAAAPPPRILTLLSADSSHATPA